MEPNIRIKGFDGDWEQRSLGDIFSFQNGFNGGKEVYGSGIPLISVMDVLDDDFITYDKIRGKAEVSEEERERFSVNYGDVLFQRSSENVEDADSSFRWFCDQRKRYIGVRSEVYEILPEHTDGTESVHEEGAGSPTCEYLAGGFAGHSDF